MNSDKSKHVWDRCSHFCCQACQWSVIVSCEPREEGIEPLLELEDMMCVDVPEPKSLITYIHFVYQHFMEKQQKEKELNKALSA